MLKSIADAYIKMKTVQESNNRSKMSTSQAELRGLRQKGFVIYVSINQDWSERTVQYEIEHPDNGLEFVVVEPSYGEFHIVEQPTRSRKSLSREVYPNLSAAINVVFMGR